MYRLNFLKALAGLGFVATVPKMKDEEEFAITSSDGKTAWDQDGNQVYQERYDFSSDAWLEGRAGLTTGSVITYDIPTHTLRQGNLIYYPSHDAKSWIRWTPKS